jgi:hypothetical protein
MAIADDGDEGDEDANNSERLTDQHKLFHLIPLFLRI